MAKLVNIPRSVQDKYHRYKMPELTGKVESKGNGIKTVLENVTEVADALNRPVNYIVKYFGCTLGSQTEEKDGRYIVKGDHSNAKLQKQLDKFIDIYVLCKGDKNPETKMIVKNGTLVLSCKACGHHTTVNTKDKLLSYILKNPPASSKGYTDPRAGTLVKLEGLTLHDDADDDDDGWGDDTSEDAVRRRRLALLGLTEDDANPTQTLKQLLDTVPAGADLAKKVKSLGDACGWDQSRTLREIVHQLFDHSNIVAQIPAKAPLLSEFVNDETSQAKFLEALEVFCAVTHAASTATKSVAKILMAMYDAELLSEEAILAWHASGATPKGLSQEASAALRGEALPMITWLKTAEEDDDDDDA